MRGAFTILAVLALTGVAAQAGIVTKTVEYRDGDTVLEGFVAWDDAHDAARPGVLIVHQWMGLSDFEKGRARELARLGYVAFALDVYGKGVRPANAQEAGQQAGKYRGGDRALYRSRLAAGLAALRAQPGVDGGRIGAIGYCFGGTGVLELARMGADVAGVVSFHGGLAAPERDDAADVRCSVLVEHGAADPLVPDEELLAFMEEMRAAGADWQVHVHGGAKHAFTDPAADGYGSPAVGYDEDADRRSWRSMRAFFAALFQRDAGADD